MPDIDLDCAGNKKEAVIEALRAYYESIGGAVTQVAAFKTEASRSALRTIARGLDIPDELALYATSLLAAKRGIFPSLKQAYYGDEEVEQVKEFKDIMDSEPLWWEASRKIEGLITGLTAHAAGLLITNEPIEENHSIMKTSNGLVVTSNDLHQVEYAGYVKYDMLSVDAIGKIRNCLNFLLQDGVIKWQGSLRETYKKYLFPTNLVYNDEMWEQIKNNEIISLFQLNTQVGVQALAQINPTSIKEIGMINSLMRLQPQNKGDEQPLEIFRKQKENINLWYDDMRRKGLNNEEIKIMEDHLLPLYGVADTQESIMMMAMDPRISGFDVREANLLRKGIAKKSKKAQGEAKELFYSKGRELGTREELLDYVWGTQVSMSLGYSFSLPHVAGYSYIAMQEAVLYNAFPHVYWNAAVLSSEAGSDTEEDFKDLIKKGYMKKSVFKRQQEEQLRKEFMEEFVDEIEPDELEASFKEYLLEYQENEDKKVVAVNRGKIAKAVSSFKNSINIIAPDINESGYGFKPNAKENAISCGMKVIGKIGDKLLENIISLRPYSSLQDFISRVKISKDRVSLLILAGAFDHIEHKDRLELLSDYVHYVSNPKKKLTLSNTQMLLERDLLDKSLSEEIKVFNWMKYIRKTKYDNDYFVLDDRAYAFYENNLDDDKSYITSNGKRIAPKSQIETFYKHKMEKVRSFIVNNQEELLEKLNNCLFEEEWQKYGVNNIAEGEMKSMRFYIHEHPLAHVETALTISSLSEVELREMDKPFMIKGKVVPKYILHHIVGTVINKDKMKNIITLLTPDGPVDIKVWKNSFAYYDKKLVKIEGNEKIVVQPSFFEIGTYLLATGALNGENFILKKYKNTPVDDVLLRLELQDNHLLATKKIESVE